MLSRFFYNSLAVPFMAVGFHAAARWDAKVRTGLQARQGLWNRLEDQLRQARPHRQTVWCHFTSVGEFEQARPLIEALHPEMRVVLTYFSPSVVKNVERYEKVDAHSYLPLDSARNARKLVAMIQPNLLIFSKFDIWPNCVWAAAAANIPMLLIAGTLQPKSRRLWAPARPFFRSIHRHIAMHCVISELDAARFQLLCPDASRICVTGDTRFDRVYARAQAVPEEEQFFPSQQSLRRPVLVAGSTYREEETVLLEALTLVQQQGERPTLILVPHEPTAERLQEIDALIANTHFRAVRWTQLTDGMDLSEYDILVIDTVGLLAKLYRLGEVAFVGGSFHGSVHNVMEPAAMARPLLFGPTIHNAYEANLLQERGAAILVRDAQELAQAWRLWIQNPDVRRDKGHIAKRVIEENLGAAQRTLEQVEAVLKAQGPGLAIS